MKIKKLLAITLTLALALALFAGCGNTDDASPSVGGSTQPSQSPSGGENTQPAENTGTQPAENMGSEEPGENAWPDGQPLVIGHIMDLTGPEASTGQEAQRSLNFAIQALGGKFAGREIVVIEGDAGGDAGTARQLAQKMVEQDKVAAIFGPTQIGEKMSVAGYMADAGVPLILYNGTPMNLLNGDNPWVVGVGGGAPQLPTVMANYAYNELGYHKVHVMYMDNAGGQTWLNPFMAAFTALGGEILTEQKLPVPTPDFAPFLGNITDDADAIVAWTSGSDAMNLFAAWFDAGLSEKMPIVAPFHGGFTDYYVPAALNGRNPAISAAIVGTFAPITYVYDTGTPQNDAFVELWKAEFGSVPPGGNLPGGCYQAMLVFKTAVEALAGDTSPDKLIDAIFAVDLIGPEGHVSFANSQAATRDVHIVQVVRLPDDSYNYSIVKTYPNVPPAGLGS